jgi:flagellar basal body-associated protein FliL
LAKKKTTSEPSSRLMKVMYTLLICTALAFGYLFYLILNDKGVESVNLSTILSPPEEEQLFSLDDFMLQMADGKYVKLSISMGYVKTARKHEEELAEVKPILRDKVIFELMQLDSNHLGVQEIKKTKEILVEQLKPILKKSDIQSIYIDNLIVQ